MKTIELTLSTGIQHLQAAHVTWRQQGGTARWASVTYGESRGGGLLLYISIPNAVSPPKKDQKVTIYSLLGNSEERSCLEVKKVSE